MLFTEEDLTPWFPGDVKPVRKGVYAVLLLNREERRYRHWDGKRWTCVCNTVDAADEMQSDSALRALPWRALASNPKEK